MSSNLFLKNVDSKCKIYNRLWMFSLENKLKSIWTPIWIVKEKNSAFNHWFCFRCKTSNDFRFVSLCGACIFTTSPNIWCMMFFLFVSWVSIYDKNEPVIDVVDAVYSELLIKIAPLIKWPFQVDSDFDMEQTHNMNPSLLNTSDKLSNFSTWGFFFDKQKNKLSLFVWFSFFEGIDSCV